MAHFAELNTDSVVVRVLVVKDSDTADEYGNEVEQIGIDFCTSYFGGNWKQTSFNNRIRKHFAGINYTYYSSLDAFVPPKPHNSWLLNEETCTWYPPVETPHDPNNKRTWEWDEVTTTWIETNCINAEEPYTVALRVPYSEGQYYDFISNVTYREDDPGDVTTVITVDTYEDKLKNSNIIITTNHMIEGSNVSLTLNDYYLKLRTMPYYATKLNFIEIIK